MRFAGVDRSALAPKRAARGASQQYLRALPNTEECIIWPYSVNKLGYGTLAVAGKSWLAHRYAWYLTHGAVPALLRHSCDTPGCVNPRHLLEGTTQDNMDDMVTRGRSCGGERRATKLTAEDVRFIRANYIRGCGKRHGNSAELAARFGIDTSQLLCIVRGDKWTCTL